MEQRHSSQQQQICYCRVHGTFGTVPHTNLEQQRRAQPQQQISHNAVGLPLPALGNHYQQQQQQQQQQFLQQAQHRHHHHHHHHHQYHNHTHHVRQSQSVDRSGLPPPQSSQVRPRSQTYMSVPSSPVVVNEQRHHHHQQQQQRHHHHHHPHPSRYHNNALVAQAVAQTRETKKAVDTYASPFHAPGIQFVVPPPVSPVQSDSRSTAGCCGRDLSFKARRGLSSSYSALDTISTDSTDDRISSSHHQMAPQKSVPEVVKNFVHWVSHVGDKVGKSTSALIESIPSLKEDHHVVMIGLDSAGKTTVLYRLKFNQYINTVPTIGFNCEKVRGSVGHSKNLTFLVWDVGGQEKIRPLWRPYTRATDAVIFVIDSCDTERLEEAKLELHRIMKSPDNVNTPLLVVANKQDLPQAKPPEELEQQLALSDLRQLWHLEPVCAVTGEGLDVAMEHLHTLILKRRKLAKRARNKTR